MMKKHFDGQLKQLIFSSSIPNFKNLVKSRTYFKNEKFPSDRGDASTIQTF